MKILVTGANGFIGRALVARLKHDGHQVVAASRKPAQHADEFCIGAMDGSTDWSSALSGVDAVIHLAARVHVQNEAQDCKIQYRKVNVEATLNLARQALAAGVRRFIFISSVKLYGEGRDTSYSEVDIPSPEDVYGLSKWEAEQDLQKLAASEPAMQLVILRPPLVYGAYVRANFYQLLKMVALCLPLPLGSVHNQRSMVYVENLNDAIVTCLSHPAAAGETFLVSDGQDISTADLIRMIARAMHRRVLLIPIGVAWLQLAAKCLGKQDMIQKITGSFTIDSSHIRQTLQWSPPYNLEQGIQKTVNWFVGK